MYIQDVFWGMDEFKNYVTSGHYELYSTCVQSFGSRVQPQPPRLGLTLIKMGSLKNDLGNFNCLFLKKVLSDDFFLKSLCQLQAF